MVCMGKAGSPAQHLEQVAPTHCAQANGEVTARLLLNWASVACELHRVWHASLPYARLAPPGMAFYWPFVGSYLIGHREAYIFDTTNCTYALSTHPSCKAPGCCMPGLLGLGAGQATTCVHECRAHPVCTLAIYTVCENVRARSRASIRVPSTSANTFIQASQAFADALTTSHAHVGLEQDAVQHDIVLVEQAHDMRVHTLTPERGLLDGVVTGAQPVGHSERNKEHVAIKFIVNLVKAGRNVSPATDQSENRAVG
eukprot:scaffold106279_cov22-Tisochrysis_lutea.AAC.3